MHRLVIKKLGPIEQCDLECSQFMTLTGFQASGKSTIAKAIYYFRTIKDDIINLARSQAYNMAPISGLETEFDVVYGTSLRKGLENYLREKFLRTFGSSWGMSNEMCMEYYFTNTCSVKVSLKEDTVFNGKYVKINFSPSGQQECVWILNLLFYYLLQQMPILFIIEEPESHLFPESQKYITELIALVGNRKHSVVLTTHSPYVLGTLNNLLYAQTVPEQYSKKADKIIPMSIWLDDKRFDSWFVKNGTAENCMDAEVHMIQNEKIGEISKVINMEFDELLNLQETDGGGGDL